MDLNTLNTRTAVKDCTLYLVRYLATVHVKFPLGVSNFEELGVIMLYIVVLHLTICTCVLYFFPPIMVRVILMH